MAKKRKLYTPEKKDRFVQEFLECEIHLGDFAIELGVPPQTLHRWVKERINKSVATNKQHFLQNRLGTKRAKNKKTLPTCKRWRFWTTGWD